MNRQPHPSSFHRLSSLLHVLSDDCALGILNKAAVGLRSGKATIKDLNSTPRRYYRKLRELNEFGIVTSVGDEYKLTRLGAFLHKFLLNDISGLLLADQNLLLPTDKVGNICEITLINDYNKLTDFIIHAIDKSKSEILLATRYLDLAVIQRLIYALDRNVKVKTVTSSKVDFGDIVKLLGDAIFYVRPNMVKFLSGKGNYKSGVVPFSLMVIDNEITVFEIPNKEFKSAFVCMDKQTVGMLSELFWEVWNNSQTLHVLPS